SFGNNKQSAKRFSANKPCIKPRRHIRHLDVTDEWQVKRRVASGSQILEVDDTSPSHAVAPSSPAQAAALAQPTLTGIADGSADLPPQIEEVIDDWMSTWSEKNPTLQLPGNISKIIMDFVQFVMPPSSGEAETAPEAPQVAQNQLEEPDNVSAQQNVDQLTFAIQDAVGSSCATIGQPVPRLHSPDRAGPSLHIVDSLRKLAHVPYAIILNVQEYVEEIEQSWPLLMSSSARLGENNLPLHDKQRRIVHHEQDVAAFFRSEIVSKIRHIISSRRPNVLFEAIEGYPTSHADLFLKVSTPNSVGKLVCCSIPVELKRPYGDKYTPATTETRRRWPKWVKATKMPSEEFAKLAILQILRYMEGKDTRAPPSVRGSIVGNIGILSTFNVTWIVIADTAYLLRKAKTSLLAELPAAITSTGDRRHPLHLHVSQPFFAESEDLPVALAYTYVIEHVIDCMANSTGGYKEVFLE
ncbi:hypothetical protein GGI09_006668, partial [Coemansia sp. S100]